MIAESRRSTRGAQVSRANPVEMQRQDARALHEASRSRCPRGRLSNYASDTERSRYSQARKNRWTVVSDGVISMRLAINA
jgi:hypothetical protein